MSENGFHSACHASKKEWTRSKSRKSHFRQINDVVHGQIEIYHPMEYIIDTPEFQRLRRIKQLGICSLVYPSAEHSRFTHSLGVYCLADSFVKEISQMQPELGVTTTDQLCVVIAALIHDIGHGPFSHLYEGFLHAANPGCSFRHEVNSQNLFLRMLATNPDSKEALDQYLDESDYKFITELIDPPTPFIMNGKWIPKGRPREKSFLYEIVSNKLTGLDVDKLDYFLRDSTLGNIAVSFSLTTFGRLKNSARAVFDKEMGFHRIAFAEKNLEEIKDCFETRMRLHDRVYQHKTCIAIELMTIRALTLADKMFSFKSGNAEYCLSNAFLDPTVFLKLDDGILSHIMMLQDDKMKPAQEICHINLDNYEKNTVSEGTIRSGIAQYLLSKSSFKHDDIIVKINCIHRGMGADVAPITLMKFYNERGNDTCHALKSSDKTWLKYNVVPTGGKGLAHVYVPYSTDSESIGQLRTAIASYVNDSSAVTNLGFPSMEVVE
ncbi:HD domain-containing protein [Ditylenchus destructor]|uniref:HD domain-containing protein n=1 Tax=Ditylenchus destructor TaxID=166010 RepID=A0AAD4RAM5_9BILA|nr:HD domain-containing protein [Ditylenchus destructor]